MIPENVAGSPLIDAFGRLAGVAVLDSPPPAAVARPQVVFGGGGLVPSADAKMNRHVYALASSALAPLLAKADAPTNDLLFTLAAKPLQTPRKRAALPWAVQLPAGAALDAKAFDLPAVVAAQGTLSCASGAECATLTLTDAR